MDGMLNRAKDFFIGRFLARHQHVTDPHRELTTIAFNQVRICPYFVLDQSRHTGGARTIVSDFAIANPDLLHNGFPPLFETDAYAARKLDQSAIPPHRHFIRRFESLDR